MSKYSTSITRNAGHASKLLKAIANPNRLMILCQLKILGERSVNQLLENLTISQPALSQHLAVMKKVNVIDNRKVGTSIYYSISDHTVLSIIDTLNARYSEIEANDLVPETIS